MIDGYRLSYCCHILFWIFIGVFLLVDSSLAQEAISADFQIIQLAGNQIYLDWQEELDVQIEPLTGDTLYIFQDSEFTGALSVIAVNAPTVVATFLDTPFSLTRGEVVTGKWTRYSVQSNLAEEEMAEREIGQESIMDRQNQQREPQNTREPIMVSGRIMTGANLTHSTTYWNSVGSESDTRWGSVPYTNLSLIVRNLPANLDVKIQGRYSYRLQTASRINQTGQLNMYNLHITKKIEKIPIEIQIGRFHNRYETNYSYWDGMMVHYKRRNWGTGISLGWEPDRSNEWVQTSLPKTSAFIHHQLRRDDFRWSGQLSASRIFPTNFENHYYSGIEQRLDYKRFSLDGEIQVDQDIDSNSARLSRLQIRAEIELTDWLEIRSTFNERTPFILYSKAAFFLDSRSRYGVSTIIRKGKWWINNGITINERSSYNSTSYNSRVQWSQSPVWDISWSIYGSYWIADQGENWYGGLTASRSFKKVRISTGLSAYRSLLLSSENLSGSFYVDGNAQLSREFSLSIRLQSSIGELVNRNAISLSLWKTF